MKIKTNYFLRNMVDLEITSVAEYLKNSDFNYVILEKNIPIVWASDNTPVIYGGEMDVINELMELEAFVDIENLILKPGFKVMTEQDFINSYCLDAIKNYIAKKVLCNGEFDGTNYVLNTDNTFNGIVNVYGVTDILGIYVSNDSKSELTFLMSNNTDTKRDFFVLTDFDFDVIIKIVDFVEKEV